MEDKTIAYSVSYQFLSRHGNGFGMCDIDRSQPVRTMKDVQAMASAIERNLDGDNPESTTHVVVLNWRRFEGEAVPKKPEHRKTTAPVTQAFWAGLLTAWSWISIRQDFAGKAAVLDSVEKNWVDWKFTVPLAVGLVMVALVLLTKSYRQVRGWREQERLEG